MPKVFVVANWKMNPMTFAEAKQFFRAVNKNMKPSKSVEVVICPPFVYLNSQFAVHSSQFLRLGAQDCFWEQKGAFTGEISPPMLKNLGCEYVIVGHSERRRHLGETDEMVHRKLNAVLAAKMRPILCIGETAEERERGFTHRVLQKQLMAGLRGIKKSVLEKIILAYEPVWAIGTGNACSFEEAEKALHFIRRLLKTMGGVHIAKFLPILYGGSVNSLNAAGYVKQATFQGLLIGGASLDPVEFIKIVDRLK